MEPKPLTPEFVAAYSKALSEIDCVHKDGKNEHFKFAYASVDNVYDTVRRVLWANGFAFKSSDLDLREIPKGVRLLVEVTIMRGAESLSFQTWGEGHDTSDKAVAKARSNAVKYGLRGSMLLPIGEYDDDPDAAGAPPEPKQKQPPTKTATKQAASPWPGFAVSTNDGLPIVARRAGKIGNAQIRLLDGFAVLAGFSDGFKYVAKVIEKEKECQWPDLSEDDAGLYIVRLEKKARAEGKTQEELSYIEGRVNEIIDNEGKW